MAQLIGADLLILLTDTDGLFDANPAENEDARLTPCGEINDDVYAVAGGAGSKGTGGFTTKIRAADARHRRRYSGDYYEWRATHGYL